MGTSTSPSAKMTTACETAAPHVNPALSAPRPQPSTDWAQAMAWSSGTQVLGSRNSVTLTHKWRWGAWHRQTGHDDAICCHGRLLLRFCLGNDDRPLAL